MIINRKWLEDRGACDKGAEWFLAQGITEPVAGLINLIQNDKIEWANWLIMHVMTKHQCLAYKIFSAEQVLPIYEAKHPNELEPRKAIEAAKAVLVNDTEKTRRAAAAYIAYVSFASSTYAADPAADYAWYASYASYDYSRASYDCVYARTAANAAINAKKQMHLKILNYGMSLLKEKP